MYLPKGLQRGQWYLHQSTAVSTSWCGPGPVWVGSKWLLAFSRTQLPRALPIHKSFFLHAVPRTTAEEQHVACLNGCSFSLFCLLLISGNVRRNLGPVFSFSMCAANITWRGSSMRCCTSFKWIHLRCTLLSFSIFNNLGSFNSRSCPPCFSKSHTYQQCDFLLAPIQLVYLYCTT